MTKKLLAFILSFALLLSVVSVGITVPTMAEAEEIVEWDGTVATGYAGGDGSKETPYLISNGAELAYMYQTVQTTGSSHSDGKYFQLTADIYLNDTTNPDWMDNSPRAWYTSTATNGYRFTGNFDGDGHTVYGLYYEGTDGYQGLLPVIDTWNYDVTVKDLTVSDSFIGSEGNIVGVISSRLYSANYKTAHFYNINITDSVTIIGNGGDYVGGILGFSNCDAKSYYQFSGCAVRANISSGHALIGYGAATTVAKIVQSYTTATDWYTTNSTQGETAYIVSDDSSIVGKEAAKAAMPNLDWLRIWNCTAEGYPFPMDFNTNNNKGLVWSGLTSADYAAGTGTEADPYIIETAEQLARMVNKDTTTGKYFKLGYDIRLNNTSAENWTDNAKMWFNSTQKVAAFGGHLDGAGYTISGIYYNGTDFAALIPVTTGETSFKNIRISNSSLTNTGSNVNDHNVSGIVSKVGGAVTFDRCIVDETVTLNSAKSAAGLAGYGSSNITITNCGVSASITGGRRPSAMLSDFWGGTQTINNSYSVGTALTTYRTYTGANNYSNVESSTNTGVTVLTEEQMKGEDARVNMPALKFFGVTDTYPVIYQQGTRGKIWTGSIARDYAGGNGTKANPYVIETGEQLVKLVNEPGANTLGKYYVIAADIKLNDTSSENWTSTAIPWFSYNSGATVFAVNFQGVLNGEYNTISGLYYNGTDGYVGLFGSTSASGATGVSINKVIIDNSHIETTGNSASAFTGYVYGPINYNECVVGKNVTIIANHASGYGSYGAGNVNIDSSMALADIQGSSYGGAYFGDVWSSTLKISNSIGIGTFSPRRSYTGSNNYGTVEDSYGVVVVEEANMQGAEALTNMDALTGYYVTEGFPARYYDSLPGAAWSGAMSKSFASGSGTKADPYVIETAEQLARMLKTSSKNMHYVLGTDIVLTDDTTALNWLDSTNSEVFYGNFNGNGYIISGLYYDNTVTSGLNVGLIPRADSAYISSVVLENSDINVVTNAKADTYVGVLVGYITGSRTTLYSCYVAEDVAVSNTRGEGITANNAVGGFVGGGYAAPVTIDGCAYFGTIAANEYRHGVLFGNIWGGVEADRIVKNTITDANYTPSSYWSFVGEKNVSTVASTKDVKESFTVVPTLKGEEGFSAVDSIANWNDRYFGTEGYPMLSVLGKRYGDVDANMVYDDADIEMLRKYLIGASKLGYIDVNADGNKDIVDLVKFRIKVDSAAKPGGYELVWHDEFDGNALDDTKWSTTTRMSDTNELAQSSLSSVRKVADGNLQLTAMENPYYNAASSNYFEQHQYMTTGSVTTENKMSYQYGYLEIRAKVPYKEGCWPSFWLRSHNATGKQENAKFNVEVDVFEVFGDQTSLSSNLHQQGYNGSSYMTDASAINSTEVHTFENAANLSNEYHTYAFEWEPDRMAIYVDGVLNVEWKLDVISLWRYGLKANNSGFDTTMNILFNNHLFTASSSYAPTSSNIIENHPNNIPSEYDIDYVRLYQKNDGLSKLIIGE